MLLRAGFALLSRPQRGILLLAALVPFDGLLLLVPEGGWLEPWKEILVLATFGAALVSSSSAPRQRGGRVPEWFPAAAGLVLLGVVSALVAADVRGLVGFKIDFFYLLIPLVLWLCPFDARERDHVVTILMATGTLATAVGLAQQLIGSQRLHAWGYEYDEAIRFAGSYLRSFSTFTQPFSFGFFVMLVILVCLPVALDDPRRMRNRAFLLLTPVLLVGMASSLVRGAYLGLAAGLTLLVLYRYRGLVHALVPLAVAALFVPPAYLDAFLSPTSLGQRTTGWTDAFGRVVTAPLGNGIGTTGSAAQQAVELTGGDAGVLTLAGQPYQPDNYFLKTVLELGWVGLWLLLLLFGAALSSALRVAHQTTGPDHGLAAGVAASIVAATAASLVSTYLEIFPLDVYFWLLLGMLLCFDPRSRSMPSPSGPAAAASRPTSANSSGP